MTIKISKDKIFIWNDFYEGFGESDNLLKVTWQLQMICFTLGNVKLITVTSTAPDKYKDIQPQA